MSFSQEAPQHSLIFQVVQDQFVLDHTTIKMAAIIEHEGGVYKGLNIQLKPEAAIIFSEMTKEGTGKHLNLLINNILISSPVMQSAIGGNFLITGISKADAQAFLNRLNADKPKKEILVPAPI
jgi:preprotein translocase subunit SecD